MAFFQKTDGSGALLLAPGDNIAVATQELAEGAQVVVAGLPVRLRGGVAVGHKFAVRAIEQGEQVMKYGAPIGRATRDIQAGEYVHTHNVTSDYIPTFTLEQGHRFIEEAK
jgi:altronate dehydratase